MLTKTRGKPGPDPSGKVNGDDVMPLRVRLTAEGQPVLFTGDPKVQERIAQFADLGAHLGVTVLVQEVHGTFLGNRAWTVTRVTRNHILDFLSQYPNSTAGQIVSHLYFPPGEKPTEAQFKRALGNLRVVLHHLRRSNRVTQRTGPGGAQLLQVTTPSGSTQAGTLPVLPASSRIAGEDKLLHHMTAWQADPPVTAQQKRRRVSGVLADVYDTMSQAYTEPTT